MSINHVLLSDVLSLRDKYGVPLISVYESLLPENVLRILMLVTVFLRGLVG